ncbi:glycerol-3-phosphate dehydrogenase (NAD(P)+) [Thiohalospira halophila DSM 15071]|uniref:Glycerol-3-phosphate dehydrogenase [NAD(P)+] n=2 Tax=Thiohalospira halophila TaxID=381300 RepID=A0A1I1RCC2_9GAMM|nr:NAD(P)H-dependent glycerol-3-phosphate dehydrogenase [Thiohalospira halophila]SFD31939.1 glycerol-3-phosphate dehydrogenase (NAD(P)+) [Thiohalospira halophila DSM 15071]
MTAMNAPLAVIGAGSWGTALAIHLARGGHPVRLRGHRPEAVARLARDRENLGYLPGIPFPDGLEVTDSLASAVVDSAGVLVAVPSHAFSRTVADLHPFLPAGSPLAWATKGLDPDSRRLLHEEAAESLGGVSMAVISGPTFAAEVGAGRPTAVTVAANDPDLAGAWVERLHHDAFRAYTSDDLIGVELGGAVKNILAIATGIADGLGLGANTRAALITRGLAETTRLGMALGGRAETFTGLAGMGDLVLTCTDDQSRNRRFGLALGRGGSADEARSAIGQVVEGEPTTRAVLARAHEAGVEMPITEQVYRVLFEGVPPREAVEQLLAREPKPES